MPEEIEMRVCGQKKSANFYQKLGNKADILGKNIKQSGYIM